MNPAPYTATIIKSEKSRLGTVTWYTVEVIGSRGGKYEVNVCRTETAVSVFGIESISKNGNVRKVKTNDQVETLARIAVRKADPVSCTLHKL